MKSEKEDTIIKKNTSTCRRLIFLSTCRRMIFLLFGILLTGIGILFTFGDSERILIGWLSLVFGLFSLKEVFFPYKGS